MGKMRNTCKILVGKPEGRRPLIRHGHRWEDNIRMDLKNAYRVGKCGLDAIGSE
jgi:hypothetical protein